MVVIPSPSRIEVPEDEQSLQGVYLWGIDGDLSGNEARMQGCLPLLGRLGEDRVLAARTVNWDLDSGVNLVSLPSEAQALDAGTKLSLQTETAISPGQLVVLFGPEFVENLLAMKDPYLLALIDKLGSIQQGFRVAFLRADHFERHARKISDIAKDCFDREIQKLGGRAVSGRATAALLVLRNTGYALVYDQMIRALVAARIQQRPDTYRKTLKLTALRLQKPPEVIEEEVRRHLEVLLHKPSLSEAMVVFTKPHLPDAHRQLRKLIRQRHRADKYRHASSTLGSSRSAWRQEQKSDMGSAWHD